MVDNLKDIIFSRYDQYLKSVKEYSFVKKIGLCAEEIVNEAIVGTIDCKKEFNSENEVHEFILKAIKNISFSELNNSRGLIKYDEEIGEPENIQVFKYENLKHKSQELYDFFYYIRYNEKGESCSKCGSKNITANNHGVPVCKICGTHISIVNGTYLKSMQLGYSKLIRLINIIIKIPKINFRIITDYVDIRIDQIDKKRFSIIKQIIIEEKTTDIIIILKRLLTPTEFEKNKIQSVIKKTDYMRTFKTKMKHQSKSRNNQRSRNIARTTMGQLNTLDFLQYKIEIENEES